MSLFKKHSNLFTRFFISIALSIGYCIFLQINKRITAEIHFNDGDEKIYKKNNVAKRILTKSLINIYLSILMIWANKLPNYIQKFEEEKIMKSWDIKNLDREGSFSQLNSYQLSLHLVLRKTSICVKKT